MVHQTPKISIIVPIYNAENVLQRCISSLMQQSEDAIEIIAVDDCSTDNSLKLLYELSHSDERIHIVRMPENKGPHLARELGVSHAAGEYIAFVDSDDWCGLDMYEKLLNIGISDNADIVMCDAMKHNKDKDTVISSTLDNGSYTFEQIKDNLYLPLYGKDSRSEYAYGYLWRFIFRRDLFKDIVFHEDVTLYEDEILLMQLLKGARQISVSNEPLYHYDCTEVGSLSRKGGYWPEFWNLMRTSTLAKQDIAKKHELSEDDYMARLGTFLYKGYLRAISNETSMDNKKSPSSIEEFLSSLGEDTLLDGYIDYIETERFSPGQYQAIIDRKTDGPQKLYTYYCETYAHMTELRKYLDNEVLPYGI